MILLRQTLREGLQRPALGFWGGFIYPQVKCQTTNRDRGSLGVEPSVGATLCPAS